MKVYNMLYIFLASIILVMGLASASDENAFPLNSNVSVDGICLLTNDSVCSNCQANLTMYYPNSSIFLSNVSMTNQGNGNFSVNVGILTEDGDYPYSIACSFTNFYGVASDFLTIYVQSSGVSGGTGTGSAIQNSDVSDVFNNQFEDWKAAIFGKVKYYVFLFVLALIALYMLFKGYQKRRVRLITKEVGKELQIK